MGKQLWRRSAIELAGLIKDKSVSRVGAVESHIERISEINPYINAVAVTLAESARKHLLGISATVVQTRVADGLPASIQIYADMWREDICLEVAGIVEQQVGQICPIDPVR